MRKENNKYKRKKNKTVIPGREKGLRRRRRKGEGGREGMVNVQKKQRTNVK